MSLPEFEDRSAFPTSARPVILQIIGMLAMLIAVFVLARSCGEESEKEERESARDKTKKSAEFIPPMLSPRSRVSYTGIGDGK